LGVSKLPHDLRTVTSELCGSSTRVHLIVHLSWTAAVLLEAPSTPLVVSQYQPSSQPPSTDRTGSMDQG